MTYPYNNTVLSRYPYRLVKKLFSLLSEHEDEIISTVKENRVDQFLARFKSVPSRYSKLGISLDDMKVIIRELIREEL